MYYNDNYLHIDDEGEGEVLLHPEDGGEGELDPGRQYAARQGHLHEVVPRHRGYIHLRKTKL